MPRRPLRPATLAALALAALGCASSETATADGATPVAGAFSRVEVAFADTAVATQAPGTAAPPAGTVRQGARDWLEHDDRLASDGALQLEVTLESAHLRGAWVTWLFSWLAPPDHLAATVAVRRDGALAARYPVRVESGVSGYAWRDREERLDRLARRLGHRVAEGL